MSTARRRPSAGRRGGRRAAPSGAGRGGPVGDHRGGAAAAATTGRRRPPRGPGRRRPRHCAACRRRARGRPRCSGYGRGARDRPAPGQDARHGGGEVGGQFVAAVFPQVRHGADATRARPPGLRRTRTRKSGAETQDSRTRKQNSCARTQDSPHLARVLRSGTPSCAFVHAREQQRGRFRRRTLAVMSRFLTTLLATGAGSPHGMTSGEPRTPVRRSWPEIHDTARRGAGALAAAGIGQGSAVGVLAGEPAAIAPAAQAVWLLGGSVTMLHQPTPRTDLALWAKETVGVLTMIGARLVLLGAPFEAAGSGAGRARHPVPPARRPRRRARHADGRRRGRGRHRAAAADQRLDRRAQGRPDHPPQPHANIAAMVQAAQARHDHDVMVSWLPLFHDMGMVGFLTVPMAVGIELVSVTPTDFLARPLLWAELICSYRGTVTAAPELRLRGARPPARPGRRRVARPVDAALRAQRRRADRPDTVTRVRRRPGHVSGCARGLALRVRDGRDDAGGVVRADRGTGLAGRRDRRRRARGAPPRGAGATGTARGSRRSGRRCRASRSASSATTAPCSASARSACCSCAATRSRPATSPSTARSPTQDADGWLDTGDEGYLDRRCRRGVRPPQGRDHHGRPQHLPDRHRARRRARHGVRAGNAVAVRLDATAPGTASRSPWRWSRGVPRSRRRCRRIAKDVTSRVVSAVGVRPAEVVVLPAGQPAQDPVGQAAPRGDPRPARRPRVCHVASRRTQRRKAAR